MIYEITYIETEKGKKQKLAHPVKDRKALLAKRNSAKNLKLLEKYHQGDTKSKAKLLQLAYNLGYVDGPLAGCKSIGSFFFYDVDCYDKEQSETLKNQILEKKDAIGLVMLEKSAGGGYHAVCKRVPGTTILENQVRVSCLLKIEMDTGAHDLQRVVYSTSGSEEDLIYLDDALFEEPMMPEACEKEYKLLKERERKNLEEVPKGAKKANKHYRPWEEEGSQVEDGRTKGTVPLRLTSKTQLGQIPADAPTRSLSPCATEVVEATVRTRYVFRECMKEEDVTEADLVNEGGRHNSVKVVLSHCNQLLSEGETLGVLKELMPNNWNDENIRTLVKAYYTDYYNPAQRLSVFQKRVFRESKRMDDGGCRMDDGAPSTGSGTVEGKGMTSDIILQTSKAPTMDAPLSEIYASSMPPKMPDQQPKLIKLLTSNTPEIYKATVAHAVFPSLGAHLHQVQFRYTDNVLHEATLMNVAMAVTGGGKGCIDEPIDHIMADIRERDVENEQRLKDFNDACNRKGANKDKPERPDDLVIQEIHSDVTHAGFVQRLDEAQKRFLYFKLNEIEMFDQLKSKPGQQFVIICQSFDPGNRYGQTRAGSQSVSATVSIRFNWNSSGTIEAVQQYFAKVLTKGPISRINFCTIPEREIGAEQPIYGIYDEKFDEQLQPYIKNLTNASGIIVCKQAKQLALKLIAECAEFSRLSQDRVFENLSFRANVIAYLKACVLYVANGCKWEKSIEDFIRWSLHYDLWCKMRYFAAGIRRAENAAKGNVRGPRNLLALLPDEFTYQEAVNLRLKEGKSAEGTSNMLNQWVFRQYILRITDYSFKKLMYKKNEQG